MGPYCSFPCSKELATRLYPEPVEFSIHPHSVFKMYFNIILPSIPMSLRWSLNSQYILTKEPDRSSYAHDTVRAHK
jgi:hypothetical protein